MITADGGYRLGHLLPFVTKWKVVAMGQPPGLFQVTITMELPAPDAMELVRILNTALLPPAAEDGGEK